MDTFSDDDDDFYLPGSPRRPATKRTIPMSAERQNQQPSQQPNNNAYNPFPPDVYSWVDNHDGTITVTNAVGGVETSWVRQKRWPQWMADRDITKYISAKVSIRNL